MAAHLVWPDIRGECRERRRAAEHQRRPLFLNGVPPLNMIVLGRDHKLYYEAYNDASDLNGDGALDIRYKGFELKPDPVTRREPYKIDYYGYFDSYKCYDV